MQYAGELGKDTASSYLASTGKPVVTIVGMQQEDKEQKSCTHQLASL